MSRDYLHSLFALDGKVAVVTGGTGLLGSAMARGLAAAGARVGILGRRAERASEVVGSIEREDGEAMVLQADVLQIADLEAVRDALIERWGRIDILVNAAGGAVAGATVPVGGSFFDLQHEALQQVVDLNLFGTLLPSQVFGAVMARQRAGCIVNISSMAALRPLTRGVGYGAAKAAIDNFTRWLAVELAQKYGEGLRVNAIAPGFFIAEQNRALLLQPDGTPTERGRAVITHTPAGRFGEADDLVGAIIWLCSPSAAFVTGTVIPVDGGFNAFSGV